MQKGEVLHNCLTSKNYFFFKENDTQGTQNDDFHGDQPILLQLKSHAHHDA